MPLLLLSSGARPRYLEDVVRALALPQGGTIQFRYETKIVSPHVAYLVEEGKLKGQRCYLTYLDNRDKTKRPEIVPVREATIVDARKFGSSYIFYMTAERYVRTEELSRLVQLLESGVQDSLPSWSSPSAREPSGYWVNSLNSPIAEDLLVVHDPENRKHLEFFEQTVRNLSAHLDFEDSSRRVFFNVIRVSDLEGTTVPFAKRRKNQWELRPGVNYRLEIYHYFPEEGTHTERQPIWIVAGAEGLGLKLLWGSALRVDSEYDWKTVQFTTNANTRSTANAITICRSTDVSDLKAISVDVAFDVVVKTAKIRNIAQAIIIGVFVALPGLFAALAAQKLTMAYAALIIGGGLIAGVASVYRFSRVV